MVGERRISAVIQARMGSTRLPGKVLLPLGDRQVLWHLIERLKTAEWLDEIVVATTEEEEDDSIADFVEVLKEEKVRLFRGPEEDVLSRYYLALREDPPDLVVRVTGDSPLVCVEHMREMVDHLVAEGLDGVDAHHEATGLTVGFGSEVYRYQAICDAYLLAMHPEEREHVSLFIKRRPQAFSVAYLKPEAGLCSKARLTLDTPEDYGLLSEVYRRFYRRGRIVDCRQVLEWLGEHPYLMNGAYEEGRRSIR